VAVALLRPEDALRYLEERSVDYTVVAPASVPPIRGLGEVEVPEPEGSAVAIAVPDHTRPLPLADVLEALRPLLGGATVIFATGTHPMGPEDAQRLLGPLAGRVRFRIHDCRSPHVPVGTTRRGLRVELDPSFVQADFRVAVGLVAPHPWSGFSGGSKVILPGISSLETIVGHHARWYSYGRPAVLEGNPFREEIEEAGRLAGVDWSLNVVVDGSGRVVYAEGGDLQSSFRACVRVAERIYVRDVDGRFDSAIVFADPLGSDLYQATKALENAAPAVEDGGTLVLVASCERGFGSPEFERFLRMDAESLLSLVESWPGGNLVPAIVALRLAQVSERIRVVLLTDLPLSGLRGIAVARGPLEALGELRGRVLVVREGGFTVPRAR